MPAPTLHNRLLSGVPSPLELAQAAETPIKRVRVQRLPLVVLVAGLLITGVVAEQVRHFGVEKHQRIETNLLDDLGDAITAKVNVDIALLSSVTGLFRASDAVDRREFATFYEAIAAEGSNLQGIQGVGFSRWLSAAQVPKFERSIRAQGFPDFRVTPPGARAKLAPIEYLEPFDWRNQRAFGYDMYSNPVRRAAMERATHTGLPSLTGRVTLVQETATDVQAGVLLYVPIYGGNLAHLKADNRFERLVGWAYSPLRTADLIGSALADVNNTDLPGSRVVVFDGPEPRPEALLFDNSRSSHGQRQKLTDAGFRQLELAGRTWTLGIQLGPNVIGPNGISTEFWVALVSGVGLAGLGAMTTKLLVDNHQATKEALANSQNAMAERALASTVFEASSLAIVVTNPDGYILTANNAFTQLSGYRLSEIVGQRTNLLKSGRHEQAFYKTLWDSLLSKGFWEGDLWNKVRSGELRRHHLAISTVRDEQLRTRYFVGMLQDITDRHAAEEEVRFQALHDTLTGLANRSLLMEQLEREVALGLRHGGRFAVIYIDLDGFKPVNDRLGHAAGDALLTQVAERLRHCTRESDVICRQGGDEFVVLVPQAGPLPELETLGAKLLAQLQTPFNLEETTVQINASIGIARFPEHGNSADALLQAADGAMYRAKTAGGGKVRSASGPMPV
ncbi:MAG: CHASE domain-containing protein [Cyanobacteriota bacterium]|nr:CHASE domain-containing protein [Cyanobacteriota bacterium]